MEPEARRSSISGITLVSLGVLILIVIAVLTGGGMITTSSGCQDRVETDPEYQNGANFYGVGLGFCIAK